MSDKETTGELLDGRAATYGNRVLNMDAAADMVNAYMDGVEQRSGVREMTGADFAMTMLLYKVYRFAVAPDYGDNIDDIEGYAQIARECVGDNMIYARSAAEYQLEKAARRKAVRKAALPPVFQSEVQEQRTVIPPITNPKRRDLRGDK